MAQRCAHPVAGDDAAVGVIAVYAACAARRHDHGVGADLHQRTIMFTSHRAARMVVINQKYPAQNVRQRLDLWELQGSLEQGMQHMQPVLSAANRARSIFIPPKRRTLTLPSGRRSIGQPHCSSCVISVDNGGQSNPRHPAHTASLRPLPYREMVVKAAHDPATAAEPPGSDGVKASGTLFEISAIFSIGIRLRQQLQHRNFSATGAYAMAKTASKGLHDIPSRLLYFTRAAV